MSSREPSPAHAVELASLCRDLFASFTRSDQRRWGEVYVRGLLSVSGRKSIRRMAEQVVGWEAEQCLQQFVNQSPWDWVPVRRRLVEHAMPAVQPKAWVVREVVMPKNGSSSVGVDKQYAHSIGRMINCQMGLAVFLAGDSGASPVNWRLLLPRSWDEDPARRSRAHLPPAERHRSRWDLLLDAVDEMIGSWGLSPAPILVDACHTAQVEPLLSGLEERGLRYVVQVTEGTRVSVGPRARWSATLGELVAQRARHDAVMLSRRDDMNATTSRFVALPLTELAGLYDMGPGGPYRGARRVLAEWPVSQPDLRAIWLTNLSGSRLLDLIGLLRLGHRADQDLATLADGFGLRHFEGRSFRGWHHHVTLVSVAFAYRLLRRLEERDEADLRLWSRV
ncbi:IS701 family transposase [Sphaerisporangium siamense]|uniref:IS701 family transposase n=1 Tax=Sphaerisporangium siamense TaxID=795645 RepID=UPI0016104BFD